MTATKDPLAWYSFEYKGRKTLVEAENEKEAIKEFFREVKAGRIPVTDLSALILVRPENAKNMDDCWFLCPRVFLAAGGMAPNE